MPVKLIKKTKKYTFALWEILESNNTLINILKPSKSELLAINNYNQLERKKQNIAARILINIIAKSKAKLYYLEKKVPFCKKLKNISISHSKNFCGVVSSNTTIGLDIQNENENMHKLAPKFMNQIELNHSNQSEYLHYVWCSKEAIYKTLNGKPCSFKKNLIISQCLKTKLYSGLYIYNKEQINYSIQCDKINNYFISIATLKK